VNPTYGKLYLATSRLQQQRWEISQFILENIELMDLASNLPKTNVDNTCSTLAALELIAVNIVTA
jgi:hypothetical protein